MHIQMGTDMTKATWTKPELETLSVEKTLSGPEIRNMEVHEVTVPDGDFVAEVAS